MTRALENLSEIASDYEVIVLDQWGVLHDGNTPYRGAVETIENLRRRGHRLAVLSNSGKRSEPNVRRISGMGFGENLFETVMTSGEALWRDIRAGIVPEQCFLPIEGANGDAEKWADGLEIDMTRELQNAEAVLLMGLPEQTSLDEWQPLLGEMRSREMRIYCSNPDRQSPRHDGLVVSPGALAHLYVDLGGETVFYGKPHRPIFEALCSALNVERVLMVGDSLEHDIAGGHGAGWDTLLIEGGLYAARFGERGGQEVLDCLCAEKSTPAPTYRMRHLN